MRRDASWDFAGLSRLTIVVAVLIPFIPPGRLLSQSGGPSLTAVTPNALTVSGTPTAVTITGSGFQATSVAKINSTDLTTTFLDANTLTTIISPSFLATSAPLTLSVNNPSTNLTSNSLTILVLAVLPPQIQSASPNYVKAGTTATVSITGSNLLGATAACKSGACSGVSFVVQPQVSANSLVLALTSAPSVTDAVVLSITTPAGTATINIGIYNGGEWERVPIPEFGAGSPMVRLLDGRVLAAHV